MQIRMILGSLYFVDGDKFPADNLYIVTLLSVLIFFILGSELRRFKTPKFDNRIKFWHRQPTIIDESHGFQITTISILILSIFVTFAYYYAIGFNVFLLGVSGLITGSEVKNIGTMRLESYSEGNYYAPGYVNQFKNILLPLLAAYFVLTFKQRKKIIWLPLAAFLVPAVIVATLGTGQRAPFLIAVIIIVIFNSTLQDSGLRKLIPYGIGAIAFFMLSSLLLGRHVREINDLQDIWLLFWEFPERILKPNQLSAVIGFREIHDWPTSWGKEMLMDLLGLLPGRLDYVPVAHRIHEILYGSDRGTAPLSINGDLWLNFNILGITVIPLFLGYFYTSIYYTVTKGPKTAFRILLYSAFAFILGSWCAGGVKVLVEYGFIATAFLLFLGKTSLNIIPRWRIILPTGK